MTFSLIGRCIDTGQFGAAVTTSSICVGARVPFVMPGAGAVLTQHRTDPRLGQRGLALLRSGCTAQQTIDALIASTPDHRWRQLAVIDAEGATAHFHGGLVRPSLAAAHADGVIAIGNKLTNDRVPAAMVAAFLAAPDEPLAERLLRGLEAGEAAGGENGQVWSAALLVAEREAFPLVDLRVDKMADAITGLRALWDEYEPMVRHFVVRATDPDRAEAR
jgi:uncharacterized Ntn-hydrolase superfamily protein